MKILFVTHRYPPRTGGIETHVKEIATRLVKRGNDVTVFSADAGNDVPAESTDEGVNVRRFRSFSPEGAFYIAPQLGLAVHRSDADVVHAHNYHAFPLVFAALGVTDQQFVVTTHYHGESANKFRDELLSLYQPIGRWVLQQANNVIAVSEWEQERLRDDFNVDATVIPNGLNVQRFSDATPEIPENPYLLCVGRLEDYKGVQHVIRALSELEDYNLLVVGTGPYQDELERISQKQNVAERVRFLGYVKDDRLAGLYAGADVYVTLSEFESYGMTVAEALATETPCVIRRGSALEDWLAYPGVFSANNMNPKSIATTIQKAVNGQPDKDSLPTWEMVVKDTEAQYCNEKNMNL